MANGHHEVEFAELCCRDPKAGYALDYDFEKIYRSIPAGTNICKVSQKIRDCIEKIEESTERKIKEFWIRKTYARKKEGIDFVLNDPSTWKRTLTLINDTLHTGKA